MATVTKKELVETISKRVALDWKTVRKLVQEVLDQMIIELGKGNRLEFRDFGVFEVRERKPRTAQNPKTLRPVDVPARKAVRFKASQLMKLQVSGRAAAPTPGGDAPAGMIEAKPVGGRGRRAASRLRLQA